MNYHGFMTQSGTGQSPPVYSHPAQWLVRAARCRGDGLACLHGGRSWSFAELDREVARVSAYLAGLADARVIGQVPNCPWHSILVMCACLRLGRAWLPLDAELTAGQTADLIRQSGCKWVLTDHLIQGLPKDIAQVALDGLLDGVAVGDRPRQTEHSPDDILLILPTSGTGGRPKGVMLSAANLAASATAASRRLGLVTGDRWLNCLPLSHIAGLAIPLRCQQAGATLVLHDGFDAARVWDDLQALGITHLSLVPAMLGRVLDVSGTARAPASLRVVLIGGGPLAPALARRAHAACWPLVVSYGMSETGSLCVLDDSPRAGVEAGRVGRPLDGFELALTTAGLVRLSGPAVMAGYANPGLMPGTGLESGWFETGDLGAWDARGWLRIFGRADAQLNSGGVRLHPQTVEQQLLACNGVRDVAVSSREDPLWGCLLYTLTLPTTIKPCRSRGSPAH